MATYYTLECCNNLINKYLEKGGNVWTLQEGCLGLGTVLCEGDAIGLKNAIIREIYLNEWSSGHTIRFYNTTPKKYLDMLEKIA